MLYPKHQDRLPPLAIIIITILFVGFILAVLIGYEVTPEQLIQATQTSWNESFNSN